MSSEEHGSASRLISLLEEEARADVRDMDRAPELEDQIQLVHVQGWYLETEKLIRVLANVLPSTMAQPINQLRYAGHHVLKAVTAPERDAAYRANVVEAFKHCKRAYYDALDLYVYHMAEAYRDKLSFLPDPTTTKTLARELAAFLERIGAARLRAHARIDYYAEIQADITAGLAVIARVNEAMAAAGVTAEIVRERAALAQENRQLRDQIDNKLRVAATKFNVLAVLLAFVIALTTAVGLLFQGVGTRWLYPDDDEMPRPPSRGVETALPIETTPDGEQRMREEQFIPSPTVPAAEEPERSSPPQPVNPDLIPPPPQSLNEGFEPGLVYRRKPERSS
ncbi:hypothetical protein [Lamprobacter sp.]|uniref:hypothetical protein n=1 Tax=Lamprobacter sp. TaxID=3100796 RepID=UPI002B25D00D|nr:hypothetical protein [Lamprobacter sp.]